MTTMTPPTPTAAAARSSAAWQAAFVPSPQQAAVFDWVRARASAAQRSAPGMSRALFLRAAAGAGKTTTLIEAVSLIDGDVAVMAYNKKISVELQDRCAAKGLKHVTAGTVHSFGYRACRNVWPKVEAGPDAEREKWAHLMQYSEAGTVPEAYQPLVRKLVGLAKNQALGIYGDIYDEAEWRKIIDHHDLSSELEDPKPADIERCVRISIEVLVESNRICCHVLDFDDMVYAPLIHNLSMFEYDGVLGDEWQDANNARRALVRKMLKPNGLAVFVGDEKQAIYGFAGADSESVAKTIEEFGCDVLPLSYSYRCPRAVTAVAQKYAGDHIQPHPDAPEGEVLVQGYIDEKALDKTDAILCRLIAPLVERAYKLLRAGVACHVEGRDIGKGLIEMLTKWKVRTTDAFLKRLDAWEERQIQRVLAKGDEQKAMNIQDRAETLRIICEGCALVEQVVAKVERLFADTNGKPSDTLTLSTVHKAKGREWNTVYILGFDYYMPHRSAKLPWQKEQEINLIYVAVTRAKRTLVLAGLGDPPKPEPTDAAPATPSSGAAAA